jgi:Ca-activated chloride channel family protein
MKRNHKIVLAAVLTVVTVLAVAATLLVNSVRQRTVHKAPINTSLPEEPIPHIGIDQPESRHSWSRESIDDELLLGEFKESQEQIVLEGVPAEPREFEVAVEVEAIMEVADRAMIDSDSAQAVSETKAGPMTFSGTLGSSPGKNGKIIPKPASPEPSLDPRDRIATNARDLGGGADHEPLPKEHLVVAHPPRHDQRNNERYGALIDNPFKTVANGDDATTFAVDVDTAAYTNSKRFLLQEQRLPPADSVRVEEFINSFDYNYQTVAKDDNNPVAFRNALVACPWNDNHHILRVALQAKTIDPDNRPPVNLVFLIDTSGSMNSHNKIGLLKQTFGHLIDNLQPQDRVAIVTYAGSAGVALQPTGGDQRETIRSAVNRLGAGGSTAGAQGIKTAYALASQIIQDRDDEAAQTRVILATDGDFNVGVTNNDDLVTLIRSYAKKNIFLNTIGFGAGNFQDERMEKISNDGNGVNSYIDSVDTAKQLFQHDLMSQLFTVAKDTKVQIFFNPSKVQAWRQIGYANRQLKREDFNNDTVDAGDIGAGHQVTALYEIVPHGVQIPGVVDDNPFISNDDPQPAQKDAAERHELAQLRFRYKQPRATTSILHEELIGADVKDTDSDTAWAMNMAAFGMQLRQSPYAGNWTWNDLHSFAQAAEARFDDEEANEALLLIRRAKNLAEAQAHVVP